MVSYMPDDFCPPDVGPKMYNAFKSVDKVGTTNLHMDMADAMNVLMYAADGDQNDNNEDEEGSEMGGRDCTVRFDETDETDDGKRCGAVWHIFPDYTIPYVSEFISSYASENKLVINHPLHDQCFYLSSDLRSRLASFASSPPSNSSLPPISFELKPITIHQRVGDAIFVPAGYAHQVRNTMDAIKVAIDFVSPERYSTSVKLVGEFRKLWRNHSRRVDILQGKMVGYQTVKRLLASEK